MPYNRLVRRVLAIAIVLILGLPAVSPLFALNGVTSSDLPACCRRDGRHHCMAMAGMPASSTSSKTRAVSATVTGRCPFQTRAMPGTPHSDLVLNTSAAIFAGIVAHPAVSPQTESKRRISADRSRQKRGPPCSSLA